uniref:Uncharacterized protein n=1 Tax=Anguilla anguilla TaxID=7936 RepID=A0A0E9RWQ4_ANGAN
MQVPPLGFCETCATIKCLEEDRLQLEKTNCF